MLHAALPQSNLVIQRKGAFPTFDFPEFNVSVMLCRNPFLVDLVTEKIGRVLKLDSIQNGNSWKGYDMLIFNTWHWWLHKGSSQPWDYIQKGDQVYKDMDRMVAFEEGLKTWSKWVDSNVDPSKTKVFFQGISPTHYRGEEWNASKGMSCKGETQPIAGSTYPGGPHPATAVVKEVLSNMSKPVTLLDITTLSQLRKDSHPSLYGDDATGSDCSHCGNEWNEPAVQDCRHQTEPIEGSSFPGERYPGEVVVKDVLGNMTSSVYLLDIALLTQLRKDGHPSTYAGGALDCSHWCVSGVPDSWNQILYSILIEN
nr:protein trichome birefringence-like 41 [Ipomoea batatas]